MPRYLVTLLIFSLALAASSCSNQSAFEPSQPTVTGDDHQQPSFSGGGVGDDPTPRKGGPGGSAGGWKK
jgi:hypothetical protein